MCIYIYTYIYIHIYIYIYLFIYLNWFKDKNAGTPHDFLWVVHNFPSVSWGNWAIGCQDFGPQHVQPARLMSWLLEKWLFWWLKRLKHLTAHGWTTFFLKDVVILMILMIDCPIWMVQTTDEKQRWMAQTKNEQFHLLFSAIPNLPPYLRLDDVWCFHPLLVCWMVKSPCFIIQQPFLLVKLHVWWQTSCVIYIP